MTSAELPIPSDSFGIGQGSFDLNATFLSLELK